MQKEEEEEEEEGPALELVDATTGKMVARPSKTSVHEDEREFESLEVGERGWRGHGGSVHGGEGCDDVHSGLKSSNHNNLAQLSDRRRLS